MSYITINHIDSITGLDAFEVLQNMVIEADSDAVDAAYEDAFDAYSDLIDELTAKAERKAKAKAAKLAKLLGQDADYIFDLIELGY